MLKTALGYFFLQLSLVGLTINIMVLITLIRLIEKCDKHSVHLISVFIVINDILSLIFNTCYFSPSVIVGKYLVSDRLDSPSAKLIASVDTFTWYMANPLMLLMVSNRMAFVVFNQHNLFGQTSVYTYMTFSSVASLVKILLDLSVFPCCLYLLDYQSFGYTLLRSDINRRLIDTIHSIAAISFFAVIFLSFLVIFVSTYKSHKSVPQSTDSKFHQKIRARECSYSVQFVCVSLFFMIPFASFRLNPFIFGENCTDCNVIVPVLWALCSTANGSIYIVLSQEVRHELFKRIFKNNSVEANREGGGVPQGLHPEQLQNIF